MSSNAECYTPDEINEAFIAAPPLIAEQILDLTLKTPDWARDLYATKEWPKGAGTLMQQIVHRGDLPKIERGLDKWKKLNNNTGCESDPANVPNDGYVWTTFGGSGFDIKLTELMERDFRTPAYEIHKIQTTAMFEDVFANIIKNIYRQVDFFKSMNIGLNVLQELAKKFVVDSAGAKIDPKAPYTYPNIGSAKLSMLNVHMLGFFYEHMRRIPDCVPYDVVDGSPVYALMASHQLLHAMFMTDDKIRQDLRFSGYANDLLNKYNFMSTTRGMFINVPILYPRRFNIVDGEPVEVLPFVSGVPAHVGTYAYLSPEYEAATHEEVLLHGKNPFSVFTFPTQTSLPGGATFGPEPTFLENWQWVNPQTTSDPFRRRGYFASSAKIGISQQFSEGIFAILVKRPSVAAMAMFEPAPEAPPTVTPPTNVIPEFDSACACAAITGLEQSPFDPLKYFVTFASQVSGTEGGTVNFALDNGGYITGTLEQVSSDGHVAEVSFSSALPNGISTAIVNVYCGEVAQCSALVVSASDCRSGVSNSFAAQLSNPIVAVDANDVVTGYFADAGAVALQVVSYDPVSLTWVFRRNGGSPTAEDILCQLGGLRSVCVPPATDASCPACGEGVTETPCESEITEESGS